MESEDRKPKIPDPKTAQQKAEKYCVYQERAQQEVREKLYSWGLHQRDAENIISELISNNFLSEERFANAYALGKFRQKGWGKIKINQALKLKRVPEGLIKKALKQIDLDDYLLKLKGILEKKDALLKEKDAYKRSYQLKQYAFGKGYEGDLVAEVLKANDL
ncbi:regulatory protein RecX [Mucilaginibacter arboris]|uniref:Regulatory protein RecX n=1 Tax=Mucilaginibacter arboris TaxID=2682090 RepID=A0A7K1SYN9_9SPHI|nr:regulatory protein RecX [Mucilaginibacter arboris]MVN22429.1 RecX family transcriptional regulator [Mucilaginibacter arboris]